MEEVSVLKVRIKFSKTGTMRYIGHLDVMRYFQKALRRAGFDTTLSGGFSPHMIMSFAAPLGVGITSEGEYFDLELGSAEPSAAMEEKLNAVMADGISVRSIRRIPDDKKAGGMRLVAAADYLVSLPQDAPEGLTEALAGGIGAFLEQPEIMMEKNTKKGSRTVDIRPLIYQMALRDGQFYLLLSQGSVNNLKPEPVITALAAHAGLELPPGRMAVHRLDLYADTGDEQTHVFRSLEELGDLIV